LGLELEHEAKAIAAATAPRLARSSDRNERAGRAGTTAEDIRASSGSSRAKLFARRGFDYTVVLMGVRTTTVALGCIAAFGVVAALGVGASACSSSSSKSTRDAGSASDSAGDALASETGPADAGEDAACVGLDAATAMIGFPAKCEDCLATSCCAVFNPCWSDPACQAVELCTGDCIEKQGMSPLTCATKCGAETDSGATQTAANALNQCIVTMCPTPCNP
jgi:hypothetical protein